MSAPSRKKPGRVRFELVRVAWLATRGDRRGLMARAAAMASRRSRWSAVHTLPHMLASRTVCGRRIPRGDEVWAGVRCDIDPRASALTRAQLMRLRAGYERTLAQFVGEIPAFDPALPECKTCARAALRGEK